MDITAWLERFVAEQRASSGAVYERIIERDVHTGGIIDDCLMLLAVCNLGPLAAAASGRIQRGQGLAGLALERHATLSTCTGKPPGAAVAAMTSEGMLPQKAAVALPIQDASAEVRALVYLVFPNTRRLRDDELIQMLDRAGQGLARLFELPPLSEANRKPAVSVRPNGNATPPSAVSTTAALPVIA